ncbi:MAG: helicase RepA family protein [Chloroflexi bacterium]|nr:helicase RepA family protein [Chloroflexota bacterium]
MESRAVGGDVDELLLSLGDLPELPVALFTDTLARGMVGVDENSAQDMGLFIQTADRIRQATGATVVVLHHHGKSGAANRVLRVANRP